MFGIPVGVYFNSHQKKNQSNQICFLSLYLEIEQSPNKEIKTELAVADFL
jgi:hypothetical protein